ncbi:acyl-CoA thioesterase [candidate division KSB1 bacterium]|nr:acyl-CoA thioesterase [candidate division KSB1 bacterium]
MPEYLSARLRVRSYELDSFGHVNNAVFLNYLEFARGEYLHQVGLSFNDFERWGAFPYVVKVNLEYKVSARFDDELEIRGDITHWSHTSFTLQHTIYNLKNQKVVAVAKLVLVFVNRQQRPIRIPAEFRTRFGLNAPEKL